MNNRIFRVCWVIGLWVLGFSAWGQGSANLISEISLQTDTNTFSLTNHRVSWQGQSYLGFQYSDRAAVCQLLFTLNRGYDPDNLELVGSADFEQIDSLVYDNAGVLRTKIRFVNLNAGAFYQLTFRYQAEGQKPVYQEVKLLPSPMLSIRPVFKDDVLYVGENRSIDLDGRNLDIMSIANEWVIGPEFDYRFLADERRVRLVITAKEPGKKEFVIRPQAKRPIQLPGQAIGVQLPEIRLGFTVKTSRLAYLSLDKKDIPLEQGIGRGIEIQMDNHRNLQLKKTYRIENQFESGGALVAEIYTRSLINNEQVLCYIRPYDLHRLSDGYLYLKDGDEPRFITNITIRENTKVQGYSILSEGSEWVANGAVKPGMACDMRLEGTGLSKASISLDEVTDLRIDTANSNDNFLFVKFRIPIGVAKRKLTVSERGKPTGLQVQVREHSEPQKLDFVLLSYEGGKAYPITEMEKTVYYEKTLSDLILSFKPEKIDEPNKLYGKQVLTVTVNLFNNRKELLESRVIDNVVVCPGDNSPRSAYYSRKDCNNDVLNLNNILTRKTASLPDWSTIEVIVKHKDGAYGATGYSRKATIVLQRTYNFDLDVSFPGGLLVQRFDQRNFNSFSGVSLAGLMQFSFFYKNRPEKLKPFRVGAGVLALNAFNFSDNATNRDLGLVVLGSVFTTRTGSKFSFPLYAGFGYFLKEQKWFYLVGPGIQLRF